MMDCLVFTLKRFRRKNKIFHSQVVSTLFYFRLQVLSHSWYPDYILQPPAVLEIYYIYFGYVIRRRRKQRNRPSEEGDKQRCIFIKATTKNNHCWMNLSGQQGGGTPSALSLSCFTQDTSVSTHTSTHVIWCIQPALMTHARRGAQRRACCSIHSIVSILRLPSVGLLLLPPVPLKRGVGSVSGINTWRPYLLRSTSTRHSTNICDEIER